MIVFEADELAVTPDTRPFKAAVTVNARAFVGGLFVSETRKTNVMPETYVPLPVWYVGVLTVSAACALMVTLNTPLGLSSVPVIDAVIDNDSLAVTAGIVIKKSIDPAPRIVLDCDEFAVTPPAKPLNDAVTLNALAFVVGLFVRETRTTNVMPATYVPLPVCKVGEPVIASAACALIVMLNGLLGPALNARPEISSVPITDAVIDSDWLVTPVPIVIKKSMYPVPRIVFDADEFAVT